jgi:hypothetical protein
VIRRFLILFVLCGLVSVDAAWAASLTPSSRISTAGLGPVAIGMTKAEAQRAAGKRLVWQGPALHECRYLRPRDCGIRASFMVIGRRIARVDLSERGIRTLSGFRVGDRERRVRKHFAGQLKITRHEYNPSGWYLEVVPRDASERTRRVVFETDAKRVTYIRAGRLPEVRYIEGCA